MNNMAALPSEVNPLFNPKVLAITSKTVIESYLRLDASFYRNTSTNLIKIGNGLNLQDLCEKIFNPPVFKREFQETNENGCPYLASSEIISLNPEEVFISNSQADELGLKVNSGWILLTGFGTIGSVRIVDKLIDGCAVANNVARIVPKDNKNTSGYLAAFLSSPLGYNLLNDRASGSVVRYIEAPEISKLPIPELDSKITHTINKKYLTAVDFRETSHYLLKKAENLLLGVFGLPFLKPQETNYLDPDRQIESVSVSSKEIFKANHNGSEFRLDAHFYNPLAQLAIRNIKKCKSEVKTVGGATERVFMCNRFKRNYVGEKHGVPFLSGKNIIQIRPTDLNYISVSETKDLEELKLQQNWTLITRSGTIGRTCFIFKNYEGWTATEDIIRTVPDLNQIDPGYLNAFLSSQYGVAQILRYKHGSVIDHVTPEQVQNVLIPLPTPGEQKQIGDLVRVAYEKRAEAIRLEDEAQQILINALSS
jgi:type I restriction enzyme, S subunit